MSDLTYEGMKQLFNRSEYNIVKFVCKACETIVFWDDFECKGCSKMIEWCPVRKQEGSGKAFIVRL